MKIRKAMVSDGPQICALINHWAERGVMLHRSLESIYTSIREFQVAEDDDARVVGCIAIDVFWANLAEVKSLAILDEFRGQGLGAALLTAAVEDAQGLGVGRLFALTYEKRFFLRHGFEVVDRHRLPEKVWRECIACPKVDCCDEIAVLRDLTQARTEQT